MARPLPLSMRAVVLAAAAAVLPLAAQAYDATAEFSTTANPAGVWRYGDAVGPSSPYSFTLFDHATGSGWNSTTYQSLGAPALWVNAEASCSSASLRARCACTPGQIFTARPSCALPHQRPALTSTCRSCSPATPAT